jgi:DNA-binding NtrC family response regulator
MVPDGWRLVVGVDADAGDTVQWDGAEVVELADAASRSSDLPGMIAAWVGQMSAGTEVSPEALQQLSRIAVDVGFDRLQDVVATAVAAATSRLETRHLPTDGYCTALVDELLSCGDPLSALEERLLRELLGRCDWRMQEAADRLGVSRVTLWRKLREHGIARPEGCEPEE